mmetsp:Transcript_11356/g.37273  ORF Transcript_11356/g.37273 Transcript_11356/m.37273 type:complete len:396 (+) Transcript_11356:607-1794(+)
MARSAPCQVWSPSVSASTATASRWLLASSRRRALHGRMMKAASATRAFSPPERLPMGRSAAGPESPSAPSTALIRSSFTSSTPAVMAAPRTYSSPVCSSGSSCARSWLKTPSATPCPAVRAPSRRRRSPASDLSRVDLPAPFGPTTTQRMPRSSVKSISVRSAEPVWYPRLAFLSWSARNAHAGGSGSRSAIERASPAPGPTGLSTSTRCALSLSSAFCLLFAAEALVALAPNLLMKPSSLAASAACFSAVLRWFSIRSSRCRKKSLKPPRYAWRRPPRTSTTPSHTPSRSGSSWLTSSTAARHCLSHPASQSFARASRWFVGSSRRRRPPPAPAASPAGPTKSFARATRICHPPLSSEHRTDCFSELKPRPESTAATRLSAWKPSSASKRSRAR